MAQYEIRDRRPAPALLPAGAVRMLAKRCEEAAGLGLIIFACVLLLGYLSYTPTDPSPLKAAPGPARNLIGGFGAGITDVGLQTLGFGWLLLVGVLMLWGLRMFGHRGLTRPWLRIAALPTLMIFAALALGALPMGIGDKLPAGPGGLIGKLMLKLVEPLGPVLGGLSQGAIGLAAGACACFAGVFALGFNPWDWPGMRGGAGAGTVARKAAAGVSQGVEETRRRSGAWLSRLGALARGLRLAPRLNPQRVAAAEERRGRQDQAPPPGSAAIARARFRAAERKEPNFGGDQDRVEPSFGLDAPDHAPIKTVADPASIVAAAPEPAPVVSPSGYRIDRSAAPASTVAAPPGPPPAAARTSADDSAAAKQAAAAERRAAQETKARAMKKPVAALELSAGGYALPDPDLLEPTGPDEERHPEDHVLDLNARQLEATLQDFGVRGEITSIRPGPVVTQYELEPAPGTKSARVIGLADDIARSLAAVSVRISVQPGRTGIAIETPNPQRSMVRLRKLLETPEFERTAGKLPICLGVDIAGVPVITDLVRMPHLLIAGATGSGKSVGVNALLLSLLFRLPPDKCRLVLIDPKMLELSVYDGVPHLLAPVVTDPKKAVAALNWTVREMEGRYRRMSKLGVRNIEGYHQKVAEITRDGACTTRQVQVGFDEQGAPLYEEQSLELDPMPYIVVVVDEMADLMLTAGKEIEASIQRLAQMARAAGIHLIMATQRPSVDVITGVIKANFPSRISFHVASKIDSRTILGEAGAEQLLGQGDMLAMLGGGSRPQRIHGPFVSDAEVEAVVAHLRRQGAPQYLDAVTEDADANGAGGYGEPSAPEAVDELYDQAVALVLRERKVSTSFIQRHLQIGYNRAARIVDRMEQDGMISPANHVGRREVLAAPV